MSDALLQPPDRVLSTLNKDGSRRWLRPKPSPGRFLSARRGVAYLLIAVFVALPNLRIADKPAVLLNIPARQFTLFGKTFLPTDTVLLALLLLSVFLTIFLVTSLFGRIWCGWACPQTVYLEFVFRPIERLFDGTPGRPHKDAPWKKAAKLITFVLLSMGLAHTFLAYFVGVEELAKWVRQSPFDHPVPFFVMALVTAGMLFDFGYFREQVCIIMCPYGRLQSVLLDRDSTIISYDRARGEPRGKKPKSVALPIVETSAAPAVGDCVDCKMCVTTCPTGIDIREGLQLECVGCAQCIDACDAVMSKLDRPKGLIRYSSQNAMEGRPKHIVRVRTVLYATVLAVVFGLFVTLLVTAKAADADVFRGRGNPFTVIETGEVVNNLRVRVTNRGDAVRNYRVELLGPEGARLVGSADVANVQPGKFESAPLSIAVPYAAFTHGHAIAAVRVSDGHGFTTVLRTALLGPEQPPATPKASEKHEEERPHERE